MNPYVTGGVIRQMREAKGLTQAQLAQKLCVSDKAVSKWETGKGYPDMTLLTPLADALGISVLELLSGNQITNKNKSFHMKRTKFYVCPLCGNVITAAGEAVVSCCGIALPPLEAEASDEEHIITKETVENSYLVTLNHPMTKEHFISFLAAVCDDRIELVKLYPEGEAMARFSINRIQGFYCYCNRHGLFYLPRK